MKKIILGLAILLGAAGVTATAQTHDKKAISEGKEMKQKAPKSFAESPLFTGITLTADQKTKLDELCKSQCNDGQCANQEKATCKKKDGKLTEQQKKELKEQKKAAKEEARAQRVAKKEAMLKDIKKILSKDQYEKFLENSFVYGKAGCQKDKQCGRNVASKGKGGHHGQGGPRKGQGPRKGSKSN